MVSVATQVLIGLVIRETDRTICQGESQIPHRG
jgi:hypothetical protein